MKVTNEPQVGDLVVSLITFGKVSKGMIGELVANPGFYDKNSYAVCFASSGGEVYRYRDEFRVLTHEQAVELLLGEDYL